MKHKHRKTKADLIRLHIALILATVQDIVAAFLVTYFFLKNESGARYAIKNAVIESLLKINWEAFVFFFLAIGAVSIATNALISLIIRKAFLKSVNDFRYNWAICLILAMALTMNPFQFELVGALISFVLIFNKFMPNYLANSLKWIDEQTNKRLSGEKYKKKGNNHKN